MRHVQILPVLLLTLALVGCQLPAHAPVQPGPAVQVGDRGAPLLSTTGQPESVLMTAELPQDVLTLPVPAGFQLELPGFRRLATDNGAIVTGTWLGSAGLTEIASFYTCALPVQGWTRASSFTSDQGSLLTFNKDGYGAWLGISSNGPTTRIILHYALRSQPTPPPGFA